MHRQSRLRKQLFKNAVSRDCQTMAQEKNGKLYPSEVTPGSTRKAWWQCAEDKAHVWQAVIGSRVAGRDCPFCANKKLAKDNSLKACFPELVKEWHKTKNGSLTPNMVRSGSAVKVWWQCSSFEDHVWEASIIKRTRGTGCPYCCGHKVAASNSLAGNFRTLSKEWHPSKNGTLTPNDVTVSTTRKVWWQCRRNKEHVWQASVAHRTSGSGCHYCSGHRFSSEFSLAAVYPLVAAEWHPTKNAGQTAEEVRFGVTTLAWWQCSKAEDHVWRARINSRTTMGTGCPYCAGLKVSASGSLATKFPELVKMWHPSKNGTLKASDVGPFSRKVVWWRCLKNSRHVFDRAVGQMVVAHKAGYVSAGCPSCANNKATKKR